tara:strand:+ start:141 stop:803 length:663 start_codon:yes stop_codon:yes gene_type:complete
MKKTQSQQYIPPLKYHFLTKWYDVVVRFSTREIFFKKELIKQAIFVSGEHVLDLGCGTGTLTKMIVATNKGVQITGLDADTFALEIAKSKLAKFCDQILLKQGYAQEMPFKNEGFDVVVSSLFFHHLTKQEKLETLHEAYRVLKPGGRIHIADWGRPSSIIQRILFYIVQILDGFETTQDSVNDILPTLLEESGFSSIEGGKSIPTMLGTITLIQASKSE